MIQFVATLHVLGAQALSYLDDQADVLRRASTDRGSITIEQVLWAGAIIALAIGVIGLIQTFVKSESDKIGR